MKKSFIIKRANFQIHRWGKEWEAANREECIEEISNHIEHHIGPVSMVFHELVFDA